MINGLEHLSYKWIDAPALMFKHTKLYIYYLSKTKETGLAFFQIRKQASKQVVKRRDQ